METLRREDDMPQFLMLIADDKEARAAASDAEFEASFAKVRAWFEEHTRAGHVVVDSGRRLQPPESARTVRVRNGEAFVTDGPFAETKEMIGGYTLLDMPDIESAVRLASSWPGIPVALEVRPVIPPAQ
jgi:hypothetical protein